MAVLPQSRITDTKQSSLQRFQATQPMSTPRTATTSLSTARPSVTAPKVTAPKTTSSSKSSSSKKSSTSSAEKEYQKQLKKLTESAYSQGIGFLGEQEARLQTLQPQLEQQIAQTYESQVPEIQRLAEQQRTQITGQQEETRAQRESALAQARRQYQEGTQRAQSLFGGVAGSSAGQAQSELLAREQARQFGETTRAAQQNILGLGENLRNVEAATAQQLRQLDIDKQSALLKARDDFRARLDDIGKQRFKLAQDKANTQLAALQDFNDRRRQLEDYYTQQQDAIENFRLQSQLGLENYAQQLQIAQRFQPAAIQQPSLANLAGLNLATLDPLQQRQIAREIAANPVLQQQFRANVSGNQLQYVSPEGNFGTIPLQ